MLPSHPTHTAYIQKVPLLWVLGGIEGFCVISPTLVSSGNFNR